MKEEPTQWNFETNRPTLNKDALSDIKFNLAIILTTIIFYIPFPIARRYAVNQPASINHGIGRQMTYDALTLAAFYMNFIFPITFYLKNSTLSKAIWRNLFSKY